MLTKLTLAGALALLLVPSVATSQSCDLTTLLCAQKGQKCNIQFVNLTGATAKTCNGQSWSTTATVKFRAKNSTNKTLGRTLTIPAGGKITMNLTKKGLGNISKIKAGVSGRYKGATLSCENIMTVLNGSGRCKVYFKLVSPGQNGVLAPSMGPDAGLFFDCSDGAVCTMPRL